MPKPKGEYHYAITTLQGRLRKLAKAPDRGNYRERILHIKAAIDVLTANNMPAPKIKPLSELFTEEEDLLRQKAMVAPHEESDDNDD